VCPKEASQEASQEVRVRVKGREYPRRENWSVWLSILDWKDGWGPAQLGGGRKEEARLRSGPKALKTFFKRDSWWNIL
jgi:hypothetical protein